MTLGAPPGAFGGSNGDQSGTESRMSVLILPLNGRLMWTPSVLSRVSLAVGRLEDGRPVVLDAHHRPPIGVGLLERLLRAAGVVELAIGVVVEHERAERWPAPGPGELENRDFAVWVAGRQHGPAACSARESESLLQSV